MSDEATLQSRARELGFVRCGVARAGRSPHADRFLDWLDRGRHGEMAYLARNVAKRIDPSESLPGARSVIVVAFPYDDAPDSNEPEPTEATAEAPVVGKIARYARSRDYHKVMARRLAELAAFVRDDGRFEAWYTVDSSPLLERDWAEAAGVGWIGKNGLILDADIGSWFLLGTVVTTREYAASPPALDHCGTCTRCLDACPTDAFPAPRTVDATRCISYLTIEVRGEWADDAPDEREGWLFGCDICQEVCPYNTRSGRSNPPVDPEMAPRHLLRDAERVAALDADAFVEEYAGTPVIRAKHEGLVRNARKLIENAKRSAK